LLTEAQRDRIDVVLVSPRNPLNIGAAARAMANFGFGRLAVVAPYAPHWREARSAVGAPELLQNAKETEALAEAVAECTLVVGTGTVVYRKLEQAVVSLPDLAPLVGRELARGGRVALVFGPEKHGLTRDDLSFCHLMVEIPTDPRQPSMNLGQAVAVCLYELACRDIRAEIQAVEDTFPQGQKPNSLYAQSVARLKPRPIKAADSLAPTAPSGDLEVLAGVVEETMTSAGYSPRSMREANRHDLRLLLRRLALNKRDARRILGLFRRILWRLNH